MTEPAVLTVEEAARVLRIGRSAAYAAARAGELPVIRVGRVFASRVIASSNCSGSKKNDEPAGNGLEVKTPPRQATDDAPPS